MRGDGDIDSSLWIANCPPVCAAKPEIAVMNTQAAQSAFSSIHSYAKLQEQLHRDLLAQHPEWIEQDGSSPILELYDERVAKLIAMFQSLNKQPARRAALPSFSRIAA
jgi:hypothetical protein